MNVQELIDVLQQVEDKSQKVEISVRSDTQRYPVAIVPAFHKDFVREGLNSLIITCSLPTGMYAAQRKVA